VGSGSNSFTLRPSVQYDVALGLVRGLCTGEGEAFPGVLAIGRYHRCILNANICIELEMESYIKESILPHTQQDTFTTHQHYNEMLQKSRS
jgi:hypothetical protein